MRVLIVHASRYGSTQGIAERIAATLSQHGIETTVKPVRDAGDPSAYDAVVIGSAAYYFHWMKRATAFVHRNRVALAERPVWLFSSGPLGTKTTDAQGRDLLTVTVPREITEFTEAIHPRDHRVFFGALHRDKLGFTHGLVFKLFTKADDPLLPDGDFRDWNDIDAWAVKIAESLKAASDVAASAAHKTEVPA